MSEFPEETSSKETFSGDTRFLPGEAESGPYKSTEGMFQRDLESEGKPQGWKNLVVLAIVGGVVVLFLLFGSSMFRTSPRKHFLVGVKLADPAPLMVLRTSDKDEDEVTISGSDCEGKNVLLVLWSPWDVDSVNALAAVKEEMLRFQKDEESILIPVAYFETFTSTQDTPNPTVSPREEKAVTESDEELTPEQKIRIQDERKKAFAEKQETLRDNVNRAFLSLNLKLDHVWWDPQEEFRQTQILFASEESRNKNVPLGLGVPTFIIVREGIITYVATGFSSKSMNDLKGQLNTLVPPDTDNDNDTTQEVESEVPDAAEEDLEIENVF